MNWLEKMEPLIYSFCFDLLTSLRKAALSVWNKVWEGKFLGTTQSPNQLAMRGDPDEVKETKMVLFVWNGSMNISIVCRSVIQNVADSRPKVRYLIAKDDAQNTLEEIVKVSVLLERK